jgi:hypothetical protein
MSSKPHASTANFIVDDTSETAAVGGEAARGIRITFGTDT